MSRLDYVTIAIVAVCVAALVYLIYMTTNLLGGPEAEEPPAVEAPAQEEEGFGTSDYEDDESAFYDEDSAAIANAREEGYVTDAGPAKEDDAYGEDWDGEDSYRDKGSSESGRDYGNSQNDYGEERVTASPPREDYASVSTGDYMVLAGTFRIRSNAETMVRRLKRMGYDDASVELFDRGAFAVALVDHFPTYEEAREVSQKLKREGVEAYVERK